MLHSTKSTKFW